MLARLSGADLERLMDSIAAPTFVVGVREIGASGPADDDFEVLYGNRELQKTLGLSAAAMRGRAPGLIVPPEQAEVFCHYFHQCWVTGEPVTFEAPLSVPLGLRWLRVTVNPVQDESGAVVRLLGAMFDVTKERRAQEVLHYQHLLLRAQQDLSPDGILISDERGASLSWNARFCELWSLTDADMRQGSQVVMPLILSRLVNGEGMRARMEALMRSGGAELAEDELELRDGRIYQLLSRSLIDESNLGRGRIWYVRDMTASRRFERELAQAHALQKAMLESAHQIIVSVDHNMVFRSFNAAAERLLGYRAEEVVGKATPILLHDPEEIETRRAALSRELGREASVWEVFRGNAPSGEPHVQTWTYIRKDGGRLPVELSLTRLTDEQGRHLGYLGIATDITERMETERRLFELATTDGLTRLWNRRHFTEQAARTLLQVGRYDDHVCLALVDIDHFKRINDTYGHAAGDAVLAEVARTLDSTLRRSDFMCRWGGEEFAALLVHTDPEEAGRAAERMRAAVETLDINWEGMPIRVTLSIGLSNFRANETTLDAVLGRADAALYAAKAGGRNQVQMVWAGQEDGPTVLSPPLATRPPAGAA